MPTTPTAEINPTLAIALSRVAIHKVLSRRGEVPAIAYHIGYGSATLESLHEAMTALTGKPSAELKRIYPSASQDGVPSCPFCHAGSGCLDFVDHDDTCEIHVTCKSCGARGPNASTAERAIEKWGGRRYC